MIRKALVLTIVLLISSLATATAVIGFCAKMPCCEHKGGTVPQPALNTERADCCTTVNCYEAPSSQLTTKDTVKVSLVAVPMIATLSTAVPTPAHPARAFADTSPPKSVRERLSTLSTLLI